MFECILRWTESEGTSKPRVLNEITLRWTYLGGPQQGKGNLIDTKELEGLVRKWFEQEGL